VDTKEKEEYKKLQKLRIKEMLDHAEMGKFGDEKGFKRTPNDGP